MRAKTAANFSRTTGGRACANQRGGRAVMAGFGRMVSGAMAVAATALAFWLVDVRTASAQVFINDGTDGSCVAIIDSNGGSFNSTYSSSRCNANPATQTTQSQFNGPTGTAGSSNNASESLSLGGYLYVNAGQIGVTDIQGQTFSMRLGSVATLNGTAGTDAIAIGSSQTATANGASTTATVASGNNAIAIGSAATASSSAAIALGLNAAAAQNGSVALGSNAVTAAAVATSTVAINGKTYTFAGTAPASTVSIGAAGAERTLTNLAAGSLSATSTDAINGSQLFATNQAVGTLGTGLTNAAAAFGGGAGYNAATGTFTSPTYTLGNGSGGTTSVTNVGSALTNLDSRITSNQTAIATLSIGLNTGTNGLVQQASPTSTVTVAASTGGSTVNFTGTSGTRVLTGLTAGGLSATSTDAVNGSQLFTTNQGLSSTAAALGGGASYNATTGVFTSSTYTVGNGSGGTTSVATVGGAITNLDGRTTANQTAITSLSTAVGSGTIGLVQQAGSTANVTVAASTGGSTVNFTGTGGTRVLTGLTTGGLSATSTDAVNGSQLFATNQAVSTLGTGLGSTAAALGGGASYNAATGTFTGPTYTVGGSTFTTVGGAITNLDGRTTANQTAITNLSTALGSGTIGLVQQAGSTANVTVAASTGGSTVNFTGTSGTRVLTGVTAGGLSATSTDAINGSQLFTTNQGLSSTAAALGGGASYNATTGTFTSPTYTVGGSTFTTVGGAITNLDGRTTANQTAITSLSTAVGSGTIGLVQQAGSTANVTVAASTGGSTVNITGTSGTRVLTGLTAGGLSATSTDAVNGSQLFATNQAVSTLGTGLGSTAAALGGGASYNAATGTFTGPTYTVGGSTFTTVGGAISNLDGRTTANQTAITSLSTALGSGTIGLVQQAGSTANVTVAASTGGSTVNITGTSGTRVLTGLTAGGLSATSTDAVNGSQLFTTNQGLSSTAAALGGGASYNATTGTFTSPTYTVGNGSGGTTSVTTVGGAITNLDGRTTANQTAITNLSTAVSSGTIGLVQQAGSTANVTVAASTGGNKVNITGTSGTRVLTGLTAGGLSATSTDAVNGSQLFTTNQGLSSTAAALGGGASYNAATGTFTGPTYTIGGSTFTDVGSALAQTSTILGNQGAGMVAALGGGASYNAATGTLTSPTYTLGNGSGGTTSVTNVGSAVTNLDGRTTANQTAITNLSTALNSGTIGLVQQASPTSTVTVAASTGGSTVNITGTSGTRVLTGLTDGSISATSTDAINGSQLFTTNQGLSSTAAAFGGGASYNATTGIFTGPTYIIGGTTFTNVGSALAQTSTILGNQGTSTATAFGGGTSYNATTGTLTSPNYTVGNGSGGSTSVTGVGGVVTNINDRTTANETAITNLANEFSTGVIGLVQQPTPTGTVTVAASTGGNTVNIAGTSGTRVLTGVTAGGVSATSTDAVNGSQLFTTNQGLSSAASALGGGASYNATTGTFTGPTYTVGSSTFSDVGSALTQTNTIIGNQGTGVAAALGGGTSYNAATGAFTGPSYTLGNGSGGTTNVSSVSGAITNLDGRTTVNETAITNLSDAVDYGAIGLVRQAGSAANVTVAASSGGSTVDFTGTAGTRVLTGVAAGGVSATSTDAVNGSQLLTSNQSIASALGGGTGLNPDGTLTAPHYVLAGTTYNDVGSAFGALQGQIDTIQSSGTKGVKVNTTQADASATGSDTVAIGGGSSASGSDATAIGTGASAGFNNSTAIGAGAAASRSNQVAIGNSQNTYTMAGIASSASRAAQSGPVQIVTSDASGNLATADISSFFPGIAGISNQIAGIQSKLARHSDGIAIATALSGASLPQNKDFAITGNVGFFDGNAAMAFSGAARINDNLSVGGGIGVGFAQSTVAGRIGATLSW